MGKGQLLTAIAAGTIALGSSNMVEAAEIIDQVNTLTPAIQKVVTTTKSAVCKIIDGRVVLPKKGQTCTMPVMEDDTSAKK